MDELQRPGGELASRPLHFFWLVDCSGSMISEGKMGIVNNAIQECIPEMESEADNNPNAQLLIRALQFSTKEMVYHSRIVRELKRYQIILRFYQ